MLDDRTIAYADYPGSGNETATHLKENDRLTMMFVSFDQEPVVLRVYGRGEVVRVGTKRGREVIRRMGFEGSEYLRQLIPLNVESVRKSCGYSVPFYKYMGEGENRSSITYIIAKEYRGSTLGLRRR